MTLNIREMIEGAPSRLRYVYRFSTVRVQHRESVAEHSYFTTLYCLLICEWLKLPDMQIAVVLRRSLLHDLEESLTGDFPRSFKYSSSEIQNILDQASKIAIEQVLARVCSEPALTFLCYEWEQAKQDNTGAIVEFADFLSVLSFLLQEGAAQGNQSVKSHVAGMNEYFLKFRHPEYSFLGELLDQTEDIMREVFNYERT